MIKKKRNAKAILTKLVEVAVDRKLKSLREGVFDTKLKSLKESDKISFKMACEWLRKADTNNRNKIEFKDAIESLQKIGYLDNDGYCPNNLPLFKFKDGETLEDLSEYDELHFH